MWRLSCVSVFNNRTVSIDRNLEDLSEKDLPGQ